MTPSDRAALREAAQAVLDTQGHDPEVHAYTRLMSGIHPVAVLALLDAADERDRLRAENERLREALEHVLPMLCGNSLTLVRAALGATP